jgi:hypothetical protein
MQMWPWPQAFELHGDCRNGSASPRVFRRELGGRDAVTKSVAGESLAYLWLLQHAHNRLIRRNPRGHPMRPHVGC